MNDTFQHMGVLIKFSAYAWATYQKSYLEHYGQNMDIAVFLKMIESPVYQYRLSRIDLTADYINYENVSPHFIYNKLLEKKYIIEDWKGRNAKRKISAIQSDMETSTFYVGSRSENSRLLLRVYDKRKEQIQTNGFRLEEALNYGNWTRFEASYRGDYAHQITEQLQSISDEIALSQFIASKICDKYRFVDLGICGYTNFTNDLLSIVSNTEYSALRANSVKNLSLSKSISHIIKGSGLFPLLFKIGKIWKDSTEVRFLEIIYQIYVDYFKKDFERNTQLQSFIKKNYSTLSNQTLESCFMGEDLNKFDINSLPQQPQIFTLQKIETEKPKNLKPENSVLIKDESFISIFNMEE